ncbi:MAG: glycine cleavage system protein [Solirubrobacteraceae bacterium]|jgi:glycine cleavage system H protein|nr:glycine cleavage system protein [Solirubrobacteraceae bacterium]
MAYVPRMGDYPDDLRYTEDHEWVRVRERGMTLGITERGLDELGPIGFASLAYPGELILPGKLLARLSADEGTVTLSMPFTGMVSEINQSLSDSPALINSDPYGAGWLVKIEAGDPAAVEQLMDAEAYAAFVGAAQS